MAAVEEEEEGEEENAKRVPRSLSTFITLHAIQCTLLPSTQCSPGADRAGQGARTPWRGRFGASAFLLPLLPSRAVPRGSRVARRESPVVVTALELAEGQAAGFCHVPVGSSREAPAC